MDSETANPAPVGSLSLQIKTLTGLTIPINMHYDPDSTMVLDLKHRIHEAKGDDFLPHIQRLIHAGRELHDDHLLSEYNLQNESVVHIVLKRVQPPQGQNRPEMPVNAQNPPPYFIDVNDPNAQMNFNPLQMPLNNGGVDAYRIRMAAQLSRVVKLFALIDSVFVVLWMLTYPILGIGLALALCGYFGAKNYNRNMIFAYLLFMVLSIAARIYLIYISKDATMGILTGLAIVVEMFIMNYTWKFQKIISEITPQERDQLMMIARMQSMF